MEFAKLGWAKQVITYSSGFLTNGELMELKKDGEHTVAYLTTVKPYCFKGFHLHKIRASNYVCVEGTAKVILFKPGVLEPKEYTLSTGNTLHIPTGIAVGIYNMYSQTVKLINFPEPYYDPGLIDEQVEYTRDELEAGVIK